MTANRKLEVALVQHCATPDQEANLAVISTLVQEAAEAGAQLICLPEAFAFIGPERDKRAVTEHLDGRTPGPVLAQCQALAGSLGVEMLLGGCHERLARDSRSANTSLFLDAEGTVLARYRKIHLFDVDLADGTRLKESAGTYPGDAAIVLKRPYAMLGLTICYDLRFPALYQRLRQLEAEIITVPAAFTATTGAAHWQPLLRARAIETQCFVLAPAQHGQHYGKRRSYGHSLIIDPWGQVLAEGPGDRDAVVCASLDLKQIDEVRAQMPVRRHGRFFH